MYKATHILLDYLQDLTLKYAHNIKKILVCSVQFSVRLLQFKNDLFILKFLISSENRSHKQSADMWIYFIYSIFCDKRIPCKDFLVISFCTVFFRHRPSQLCTCILYVILPQCPAPSRYYPQHSAPSLS